MEGLPAIPAHGTYHLESLGLVLIGPKLQVQHCVLTPYRNNSHSLDGEPVVAHIRKVFPSENLGVNLFTKVGARVGLLIGE